MPQSEQYLVGGDPVGLQAVLDQLRADPAATVIKVVRDDVGRPERLVITISDDRAAALGSAHPDLIVEPDAPLQPFEPVTPGESS